MSKKNKKSHAGLIVILVILVLAVAGGAAFYLSAPAAEKNCRTVPGQHAENGLYHNGIPASEQRSLSP